MGARTGPRPLPTAIKAARGTLRRERVRPDEPAGVPVVTLTAPGWLDVEARREFRQLGKYAQGMQTLKQSDLRALAIFADQFTLYQRMNAYLRKHGETFEIKDAAGTVRTLMPPPEVAIRNAAAKQILQWCREFGFTPSSRSRVGVSEEPTRAPLDALDQFLRRETA